MSSRMSRNSAATAALATTASGNHERSGSLNARTTKNRQGKPGVDVKGVLGQAAGLPPARASRTARRMLPLAPLRQSARPRGAHCDPALPPRPSSGAGSAPQAHRKAAGEPAASSYAARRLRWPVLRSQQGYESASARIEPCDCALARRPCLNGVLAASCKNAVSCMRRDRKTGQRRNWRRSRRRPGGDDAAGPPADLPRGGGVQEEVAGSPPAQGRRSQEALDSRLRGNDVGTIWAVISCAAWC